MFISETSNASTLQTLIGRCDALLTGLGNEVENLFEARRLWTDITDFLLLAGPAFYEIRSEIVRRPFIYGVPWEYAGGGPMADVLWGAVDFDQVGRARRFLSHIVQQLPPTIEPVLEPAKSESNGNAKTGPKRRDHEQIVAIVKVHGKDWRSELDDICEELDRQKIPLPALWKTWQPRPHDWLDAAVTSKGLVVKSLENSLKGARQQPRNPDFQTPGELSESSELAPDEKSPKPDASFQSVPTAYTRGNLRINSRLA